jgi:hypothetical protein
VEAKGNEDDEDVIHPELKGYFQQTAEGDSEYKSFLKATSRTDKDQPCFSWWVKYHQLFPTLFQTALPYIAIPASAAPLERFWSICKEKCNELKVNMLDEKLEQILFVEGFYNCFSGDSVIDKVIWSGD